jgi:hypothetical protein
MGMGDGVRCLDSGALIGALITLLESSKCIISDILSNFMVFLHLSGQSPSDVHLSSMSTVGLPCKLLEWQYKKCYVAILHLESPSNSCRHYRHIFHYLFTHPFRSAIKFSGQTIVPSLPLPFGQKD